MNKKSDQARETTPWGLSRSSAWWTITTAVAVAIIVGLGALDLIRLLVLPIGIFVFGLTLAASLAPLVAWLERWIPRVPAAILVYIGLIILLAALTWGVVPSLVSQLQGLGNRLPDLIERARDFLDRWSGGESGASLANTLYSQLESIGPTLLRIPLTLASIVSGMLLVLFISFYILLEASRMESFILSLFPEARREHIHHVLAETAQAMGGYFRGAAINGIIIGLISFVGFWLIGIDFALAFGVLAGLLELVPIAGPIVATLIISGLTVLQSPGQALAVLIFMIVLQQIENNVLVPQVMRSQTDISRLLSILAIFAGGAIGGLLGALIAIPITAALRVLIRLVIAPAIRRQTGAESVERSAD